MDLNKVYYFDKYILLFSALVGADGKRIPCTVGKEFILNYDERDRSCPF